jgi:hypothetical protein
VSNEEKKKKKKGVRDKTLIISRRVKYPKKPIKQNELFTNTRGKIVKIIVKTERQK